MLLKDKIGDKETKALIEAIDEVAEHTKKDAATKEDIYKREARLEVKIKSSISDIIKWVAAMLVAQASLMAVMFRLLGLLK